MAKKVIRLTEQDLVSILKNILNIIEPNSSDNEIDGEDSSEKSLGKISAKGQELLDNPKFKEKIRQISNEVGVNENSIIKLMKHESGLDSSIKNSIGCVGLIQFCPDNRGGSSKTINGKTYNLSELQK